MLHPHLIGLDPQSPTWAVKEGTPVYDSEGERLGVVERVTAVGGIFAGIVIHTYPLPGRHLFADAEQIAEIRERAVFLRVNREALHDPRVEWERRRPDGRDVSLEARVRGLWDWLADHLRLPR